MASHPIIRVEEYEISRLGKYLEQELDHHRQLLKEEELTIDRVIEDHGKLIRENNISVYPGRILGSWVSSCPLPCRLRLVTRARSEW